MKGIAHLRIGPLVFCRPLVLSGDSPHYLVGIHSFLEDGDYDLSNNYDQALEGDWDVGARFRGVQIDRHTETDLDGRQIGTHTPFFPLLLASLSYPFGVGPWTASVAIWWTLLSGMAGIWLFGLLVEKENPKYRNAAMFLLGLATPLFCYSRDLWTESWVLLCWLGMLYSSKNWVRAALAFLATLLKYPFVVVPFSMGLISLYRRDYRRGIWLIGSSSLAVLTAIATFQWLFWNTEHSSLIRSGSPAGSFGLPFDGFAGLLFGPENGLFFFFPLLVFGLFMWRRGWEEFLPMFAFFLVHASYANWAGGTGLSARYLVAAVPFFLMPLLRDWTARRQDWLATFLVLYSVFWGVAGGFFPAIVYDRAPWQVLKHVWVNLFTG